MAIFKAIALDMMGVVYPIGDDLRDLIIPFLRREGCALPEQDLIGAYRRGYRGEPPAHFWQALGFDPPFTDIETRLMKLYE